MTTTLVPALGGGVLATQQGRGTTPGYDAIDIRRMTVGGLQEGVLNATDFMVVQRGAGANLSVDITMTAGGFAYVQGDTVSGQGLYTVPVHSATVNETITTANVTNPRIDRVILEVQDNVHDASGGNLARTRVLTGTATGGATLDNLTGAAAVPGSALLLADVLVPASDTTITNNQIRDRRKWARGAYVRIVRNTGNYTTVVAGAALLDATNLQPRIECSGVPLRVTLQCDWAHSVADGLILFNVFQNGASAIGNRFIQPSDQVSVENMHHPQFDFTPNAASHLWGPAFGAQTAGTATAVASAGTPLVFTVEEVVRQNTANNATTSG